MSTNTTTPPTDLPVDQQQQEPVELFPVAATFDDIESADDIITKTIPIPEWKRSVVVRMLTMTESEQVFRDAQIIDDETGRLRTDGREANRIMVMRSMIQPKVTRSQVDAMFGKSARAMSRILAEVMQMNGFADGSTPNPFRGS
jgi:signal recognition particle GTPase